MTIRKTIHHFVDNRGGERKNFTVEITIDMDILAHRMASRVLNSKRGKARIASGVIKARIIPDENT